MQQIFPTDAANIYYAARDYTELSLTIKFLKSSVLLLKFKFAIFNIMSKQLLKNFWSNLAKLKNSFVLRSIRN